ncbi:hypothetical protein COOONC_27079 [Cooperia oncophora]
MDSLPTADLVPELNKEQGPKPTSEEGPEGQQRGGMPRVNAAATKPNVADAKVNAQQQQRPPDFSNTAPAGRRSFDPTKLISANKEFPSLLTMDSLPTADLVPELNKEQGPKPTSEEGPEGQQRGGMPKRGEPQQQAGMLPQGEPQQQAAPPDSQQPAPQEEGQARTSGQPAKPSDHDIPKSVYLVPELNKEQGPKPPSEEGPEGQQRGGMPRGEPQQQAGMLPQGEPQQQAAPPDSQQAPQEEEKAARPPGESDGNVVGEPELQMYPRPAKGEKPAEEGKPPGESEQPGGESGERHAPEQPHKLAYPPPAEPEKPAHPAQAEPEQLPTPIPARPRTTQKMPQDLQMFPRPDSLGVAKIPSKAVEKPKPAHATQPTHTGPRGVR